MAPASKVRRSVNGIELSCPETPAQQLPRIAPIDPCEIMNRRLAELSELLWYGENATAEDATMIRARAIELYESIEPANGIEGMLAMQMVGTHSLALECLRRAQITSQTFAGRELNMKHAEKLMALFAKQLAALDKHRGKGQQKVTVEHVNVAAGGQAIVGNVEAARSSQAGKVPLSAEPSQIEDAPDLPLPDVHQEIASVSQKL